MDPVSPFMKVLRHRGGSLVDRPLPVLFGFEAAIFDRLGGLAQRELLQIHPGVRRLTLDRPGSGGSVDAYLTSRSVVAWMHGGSPTVLASRWRVPEDMQARLEICALAQGGVAELALTDAGGNPVEGISVDADGNPVVAALDPGSYTLRAWAFEGPAALRVGWR